MYWPESAPFRADFLQFGSVRSLVENARVWLVGHPSLPSATVEVHFGHFCWPFSWRHGFSRWVESLVWDAILIFFPRWRKNLIVRFFFSEI